MEWPKLMTCPSCRRMWEWLRLEDYEPACSCAVEEWGVYTPMEEVTEPDILSVWRLGGMKALEEYVQGS